MAEHDHGCTRKLIYHRWLAGAAQNGTYAPKTAAERSTMWNHYKNNKYNNRKIVVNGIVFDSAKEAHRYSELLVLLKAGEISDLKRQVKYTLIPPQREPDTVGPRGGVRPGRLIEHEVSYVADFVYKDKDGNEIVEDTKGFRTKDYVIKRKLALYLLGIRIREV